MYYLLTHPKRNCKWRIRRTKRFTGLERGDELDEQKCTQKIGILPGPTKKWRIMRIDEFYCICKKFVYFNVFLIFLWAHLCKDMGLALCLLRVKSHSLKTLWFGLMVIISVVDIYFVILLINSRNTFHYLKTPHPLELTGQVRFPVGHDAEDAGVVSMTCQQCSIYYKTLIKCSSLLFNNHCNHSTEISYKISYGLFRGILPRILGVNFAISSNQE